MFIISMLSHQPPMFPDPSVVFVEYVSLKLLGVERRLLTAVLDQDEGGLFPHGLRVAGLL